MASEKWHYQQISAGKYKRKTPGRCARRSHDSSVRRPRKMAVLNPRSTSRPTRAGDEQKTKDRDGVKVYPGMQTG
jgi:hypothetical protein